MLINDEKKGEQMMLDMDFGEAFTRIVRVNTKDLQTVGNPKVSDDKERPRPFVKWVGGKRGIINELISRLPDDISDYYEPFTGGAALFFAKQKDITTAHLSDVNIDLLLAYQAIKKDVEKLIAQLKIHAEKHSDEYFYKIRSKHDLTNPIEIAARFIYLNKTCFNGLYRVNGKGEFNVPVGKYTNPQIIGELNLLACQDALSKAIIKLQSYDKITPSEGAFVYFDPPYHPTSETAYFTQYSKDGFTEKDQINLRDFFAKLTKQKVNVMLSNSNTPFVQDLYKGYNIAIVDAPRNVNCKPNKRNSVEEVLITNYAQSIRNDSE